MPRRPKIEWPNGARIAVVLQVPFEQWEGDRVSLAHVRGLPDEALARGQADLLTRSFQRYAGKTGIWRLIDLLDRHNVTAMGVVNGLAAERFPDAVRAFAEGGPGREICAHSWANDVRSWELSREEFRANVRRCVEVLTRVSGQQPIGWVSPSGQFAEHTPEVLAEEGFLYHGDYADDDQPYLIEVNGRKLVCMSVPWETNDTIYPKFRLPPSVYVEMFCRSFDVLYEEGGQILGAVAHAFTFGRPFGIWAYDQVISYAKRFPDVWFTNRREIAQWFLEKHG